MTWTLNIRAFQDFCIRNLCIITAAIFLLLMMTAEAKASFDTRKGARALGMGGAFVAHAGNGDAVYYNPAGLWQLDCFHGRLFYSSPYNMTELTTLTANVTYPTVYGNGTVNFETYGYDLYRETIFGIAYSQAYRKKLVYGILLNYYHLYIKDGGTAGTMGLDGGLLVKPHDDWTLGAYFRNINRPKIARETLPMVLAGGVSYEGLPQLRINLDVHKDIRFPAEVRMGLEYEIFKQLALRTGFSTEPSRFSAGFGFDFSAGVMDYAFYTTPNLGISHAVSLSLYLNRQPNKKIKSSNR